jgi:enoyl-CoA hydratase/carnithine racemase
MVVERTSEYNQIACEIEDSFLVITLNRPDRLNAYTGAMGAEMKTRSARQISMITFVPSS